MFAGRKSYYCASLHGRMPSPFKPQQRGMFFNPNTKDNHDPRPVFPSSLDP
jgi:hypothetical protein